MTFSQIYDPLNGLSFEKSLTISNNTMIFNQNSLSSLISFTYIYMINAKSEFALINFLSNIYISSNTFNDLFIGYSTAIRNIIFKAFDIFIEINGNKEEISGIKFRGIIIENNTMKGTKRSILKKK